MSDKENSIELLHLQLTKLCDVIRRVPIWWDMSVLVEKVYRSESKRLLGLTVKVFPTFCA